MPAILADADAQNGGLQKHEPRFARLYEAVLDSAQRAALDSGKCFERGNVKAESGKRSSEPLIQERNGYLRRQIKHQQEAARVGEP